MICGVALTTPLLCERVQHSQGGAPAPEDDIEMTMICEKMQALCDSDDNSDDTECDGFLSSSDGLENLSPGCEPLESDHALHQPLQYETIGDEEATTAACDGHNNFFETTTDQSLSLWIGPGLGRLFAQVGHAEPTSPYTLPTSQCFVACAGFHIF